MVRFPESGRGIERFGKRDSYSLNGVQGKHGDNWADPFYAAAVFNAVQDYLYFSREYRNDVPLRYNDISAYDPSISLGHQTHNAGTDIDFRYMGKDGRPVDNIFQMDPVRQAVFSIMLEMNGATRQYSYHAQVPDTKHAPGHYEHSGWNPWLKK